MWRITIFQAASKKLVPQSFPKLKSRRIRDLPKEITKEELQRQLEQCFRGEDNLHLTFARSSDRFSMATITSYEAPELKYPIDTGFIGVTPLFDSSKAAVE